MSRQYDAKQEALKAYPTDRLSGVEMFLSYLDISESDFAYEESQSAESYIYGAPGPKKIDDGGSAFPLPVTISDEGHEHISYWNTSLRDWFAGNALSGSLAGEPGSHLVPERLATDCYAFADAMIAARKAGA
jgi:hypothetical protein